MRFVEKFCHTVRDQRVVYSLFLKYTFLSPLHFYQLLLVTQIPNLFLLLKYCKKIFLFLPSRHTTSFERLYDVGDAYRRPIDVETTSCVFWVINPEFLRLLSLHVAYHFCLTDFTIKYYTYLKLVDTSRLKLHLHALVY